MEQKAVSEVGSICFSKVLPGKKWNVKLELNWQLSKKIYTFFKKRWISEYAEKRYEDRPLV